MTELTITKRKGGRPSNAQLAARAAAAEANGGPRPEDAPPLRKAAPDDSRARADARLREIREQANATGGADRDKYWAPKPPDGWTYEWKTRTIYGKGDPTYANDLIRAGWEPVPLSRHPDMMPPGWKGDVIEIGGQWLMERPETLTREARLRDDSAARENVLTKERQLGVANEGDLSRDGRREVLKLNKHYEPIPVPADE